MDVLFYRRDPELGWQFLPGPEDLRDYGNADSSLLEGIAKKDSLGLGLRCARNLYEREGSKEKSVPILYDRKRGVIVSNESADILRMFETVLAPVLVGESAPKLYPPHLSTQIEALNDKIYQDINNGAYRAGFTSDQASHDEAHKNYFAALKAVDERLSHGRYLLGDAVMETDLRLFPTVVRHDPVYYSRMKLSGMMVADLPHLSRWLRDMLRLPGVFAATRMDHCINGYFGRTGTEIIPVAADVEAEWY